MQIGLLEFGVVLFGLMQVNLILVDQVRSMDYSCPREEETENCINPKFRMLTVLMI